MLPRVAKEPANLQPKGCRARRVCWRLPGSQRASPSLFAPCRAPLATPFSVCLVQVASKGGGAITLDTAKQRLTRLAGAGFLAL
jgi:hypothetical protein